MMLDNQDDLPRRRRAATPDSLDRATIRTALRHVVPRINDLQRESAFLNAMLCRPSQEERIIERVAALGKQIEQVEADLENAIASLTGLQRSHSRTLDVRRSLEQLKTSRPRAT